MFKKAAVFTTVILLAGVAYLISALGWGIWLRWRRSTALQETKP